MGRPEHFKCKNCCYGEPWESGVVCERFPGIPYPRAIVCGEETGGTACYAASLYKDRDDGCGEFRAEWPGENTYSEPYVRKCKVCNCEVAQMDTMYPFIRDGIVLWACEDCDRRARGIPKPEDSPST